MTARAVNLRAYSSRKWHLSINGESPGGIAGTLTFDRGRGGRMSASKKSRALPEHKSEGPQIAAINRRCGTPKAAGSC